MVKNTLQIHLDSTWQGRLAAEAAESAYTLANKIQNALNNANIDEAKALLLQLKDGLAFEQELTLASELRQLMCYIVLWQYSPEASKNGEWLTAIEQHRRKLFALTQEQPNFNEPYLQQIITEEWTNALALAQAETKDINPNPLSINEILAVAYDWEAVKQ